MRTILWLTVLLANHLPLRLTAERFYYNPYSGEMSLDAPTEGVKPSGGILADSMGMGKTLMMASLIHMNRYSTRKAPAANPSSSPVCKRDSSPAPQGPLAKKPRQRLHLDTSFRPIKSKANSDVKSESGDEEDEGEEEKADDVDFRPGSEDGPHATLVVCPVSLMDQWKSELERSSTKKSMRVYSESSRSTSRQQTLTFCRFQQSTTGTRRTRICLDSSILTTQSEWTWSS